MHDVEIPPLDSDTYRDDPNQKGRAGQVEEVQPCRPMASYEHRTGVQNTRNKAEQAMEICSSGYTQSIALEREMTGENMDKKYVENKFLQQKSCVLPPCLSSSSLFFSCTIYCSYLQLVVKPC